MPEEIRQIALRIKELRDICGYSVERVAKTLGIDPDLYKTYEEEGTDIPISVLYELSKMFGVDLTEILTGKSPKLNTYSVVKKGNGLNIDRYPGYNFESLAYKFIHKIMEPLLITVEPDEKSQKPVMHEGQEFNYVLEGSIIVTLGDESIILNQGDCIYFDPQIPHAQSALNGKQAKFLTVITK